MASVVLAGCAGTDVTRNFGWCNDSDEVVEGMVQIRAMTDGGATCGFMFGSELVAHADEDIVEEADVSDLCDPIEIRGAAMSINDGDAQPARAFLNWLSWSKRGRALLVEHGYSVLPEDESSGGETDPGSDDVTVAVATSFGAELDALLLDAQAAFSKVHPNVSFTNVSFIDDRNYDADKLTYAQRKGLGLMEGKRSGCAVSIAPTEGQRGAYIEEGWVELEDYQRLFGDTLHLVTTQDQEGSFQDLGHIEDATGVCLVSTRMHANGSGRYARQVLYGAGLIPSPDTDGAPATDWSGM